MRYLFRLGHQPHISEAEIVTVLTARGIFFTRVSVNDDYLLIETVEPLDPGTLMNQLGGTVWIAEQIARVEKGQNPADVLAEYLNAVAKTGKIHYSLRGNDAKHLGLQTKTILKEVGRSARYIEPKNTATIVHNGLVDSGTDITWYNQALFATHAVQALEAFSERDFGKPGADARSGMLPPKLARMMINLSGKNPEDITILDPFCGSGVLLMEAMSLGCKQIIGSDISKKAVDDTKKNMEWLSNKFKILNFKFKILECNVLGIGSTLDKESIDVVATEPYLGKPLRGHESKVDLERQARELSHLYIEAFAQFRRIVTPGGVIIFIIPRFRYQDTWIDIQCLEKIKEKGFATVPFTKEADSLVYWRTDQRVGRSIWRFVKK